MKRWAQSHIEGSAAYHAQFEWVVQEGIEIELRLGTDTYLVEVLIPVQYLAKWCSRK